MNENIVYDIRWSNQVDEKFVTNFRQVCSIVFNKNYSEYTFNKKFIENIYGPSVLVVVYINNIPSASRALWRNDIEGKEAYQPGDTCVMENCRGKGIFSMMTKKSIDFLPQSAIIYNFPNPNSYPGYIRLGWKLVHDYFQRIFLSYDDYKSEHPLMMDNDYAQWWIVGTDLLYTKLRGHYFLVRKDHRFFCYRIVAEVEKSIAIQFNHVCAGVFFYKSHKQTWYNKKQIPNHVVSRSIDIKYIPTWKIDAV